MKKIPGSDLVVSEICLGTMTFGEQNTKEDAFALLDTGKTYDTHVTIFLPYQVFIYLLL